MNWRFFNLPWKFYALGGVSSLTTFLNWQRDAFCDEKLNKAKKYRYNEEDIETKISKVYFHTYLSEFTLLKLFSGSASKELAREVVAHLDVSLGRMMNTKFNDGEIRINVLEEINGHKVFVI